VAAAVTDIGGEAIPVTADISNPQSMDAMVKATLDRYGTAYLEVF
jgi:hypothetical protein